MTPDELKALAQRAASRLQTHGFFKPMMASFIGDEIAKVFADAIRDYENRLNIAVTELKQHEGCLATILKLTTEANQWERELAELRKSRDAELAAAEGAALELVLSKVFTKAHLGLQDWKEKPHNAKWWKRIDGTPIPNDLVCCIANRIMDEVKALITPDRATALARVIAAERLEEAKWWSRRTVTYGLEGHHSQSATEERERLAALGKGKGTWPNDSQH